MFPDSDRQDAPKVVLINETAARRFWPGEDPIGQHIGLGMNNFDRAEVIGVVGDVRYGQIDEPAKPDVYRPHQQSFRGSPLLDARTRRNPAALTEAVRHERRAVDTDLPVLSIL